MGLGLYGVNKVRELDGILDKKHRNIIPDDVPVALLRVEFDRKPSNIANRILRKSIWVNVKRNKYQHTYGTSSRALDRAESNKHGGCARRVRQHWCVRVF